MEIQPAEMAEDHVPEALAHDANARSGRAATRAVGVGVTHQNA
jgi:hypothetical protein